MQDWKDIILLFVKERNAEIISMLNILIIYISEINDEDMKRVKKIVPAEYEVKFKVGPLNRTLLILMETLYIARIDGKLSMNPEKHKVIIDIESSPLDVDHPLWTDINNLFKTDSYIKGWELIINGEKHVFDFGIAKALIAETSNRETVINKNDVTDLKILLETSQDVNEFLKEL